MTKQRDDKSGNLVPRFNNSASVRCYMPPSLVGAVTLLLAPPHPDIPVPVEWGESVRQEARSYLAVMADDLEPPDARMLIQWLLPINKGLAAKKLDETDFKQLVEALELGAATLPAMCFNATTQRLGLGMWTWMPSVADVLALVSDAMASELDWIRSVRQIGGV